MAKGDVGGGRGVLSPICVVRVVGMGDGVTLPKRPLLESMSEA